MKITKSLIIDQRQYNGPTSNSKEFIPASRKLVWPRTFNKVGLHNLQIRNKISRLALFIIIFFSRFFY